MIWWWLGGYRLGCRVRGVLRWLAESGRRRKIRSRSGETNRRHQPTNDVSFDSAPTGDHDALGWGGGRGLEREIAPSKVAGELESTSAFVCASSYLQLQHSPAPVLWRPAHTPWHLRPTMAIVGFGGGFEVDQAQPLMPYGDDSNWLELAYAAWPTKLAMPHALTPNGILIMPPSPHSSPQLFLTSQ